MKSVTSDNDKNFMRTCPKVHMKLTNLNCFCINQIGNSLDVRIANTTSLVQANANNENNHYVENGNVKLRVDTNIQSPTYIQYVRYIYVHRTSTL